MRWGAKLRKRYVIAAGAALLAVLLALVELQVSFNLDNYAPSNPAQTVTFWAISTVVFLLTVTLAFMLLRTGVKLYLERRSGREGSRIQSKLVLGALALSIVPVAFLFAFSYMILNRNLDKWFSRPGENMKVDLMDTEVALGDEVQSRAQALANWLAAEWPKAGAERACVENRIAELRVEDSAGVGQVICSMEGSGILFTARATLPGASPTGRPGTLVVRLRPRVELARKQSDLDKYIREYDQLSASKKMIRSLYLLVLALITLFILFFATWIALVLSRQISRPIATLVNAASRVSKGNLSHRVSTPAIDELATLVRAFNEMLEDLEANSRELESRRQFTEAILESIPTGVISLASDGSIRRVNRALHGLFSPGRVEAARRLEDLFPPEESREIRYLMKRAQRVGVAASQFDMEPEGAEGHVRHLALTVSALPAQPGGASGDRRREGDQGFVLVLEDTSELLRAQKSAAWQEVARRIAHELKNPLTPIALSAERIARMLDRGPLKPGSERILRECSATIAREVESVKTLADEFSNFSRFPSAQPVPSDLNEVVRHALEVFSGRLESIDLRVDLASALPTVNIDPEQFQRVVVNLVDNAAEAMRDSLVKRLLVATRAASDSIELVVADTGPGISADDKEKLFLPYFSTKGRGTGLGLAIVSQILSEHGARIRVEDNRPSGARFYVEVPAMAAETAEAHA
ncbi:MAG TPA: ATP-binding protein [Bryobacteraceae bacterium]|nr:ATP-binding protein [Bryobacteraceae bacterium]